MKAVTGVDVPAGSPISKTSCMWKSPKARTTVTVTLQPGANWERLKTALPTAPIKPVSGVGDDAFYQPIGAYSPLGVKTGGTVFIVKVYGVDTVDKQEQFERALALDVIKHL